MRKHIEFQKHGTKYCAHEIRPRKKLVLPRIDRSNDKAWYARTMNSEKYENLFYGNTNKTTHTGQLGHRTQHEFHWNSVDNKVAPI